MSKPGSLREAMPQTAALIDALRREFGAEMIEDQVRRGLKGEPTFHAVENGVEVGTPMRFSAEFPALPSPSWLPDRK